MAERGSARSEREQDVSERPIGAVQSVMLFLAAVATMIFVFALAALPFAFIVLVVWAIS